jgi:hypothetical protein
MELSELKDVISLSFEEALELALSQAADGVLDEKIYNAIVEKLPPEIQGDFTLALTTRGIVAIPSQVAPGEAREVTTARNQILDEVESVGYISNSVYRQVLTGMSVRSAVALNCWLLENEIPVQGSYETDLKKKIKKKPNLKKRPTKWGPKF